MYHTVYAEAPLPTSHMVKNEDTNDVLVATVHALTVEFGDAGRDFVVDLNDCGTLVEINFSSSDALRSLNDRMYGFTVSGGTDNGEFDMVFDFVSVD